MNPLVSRDMCARFLVVSIEQLPYGVAVESRRILHGFRGVRNARPKVDHFQICFRLDPEGNPDKQAAWLACHIYIHNAVTEICPFHGYQPRGKIDRAASKKFSELRCGSRESRHGGTGIEMPGRH